MTWATREIDSPESQSTNILVLDARRVIDDYEKETGVTLPDDVKNSIEFLVKGINALQAAITFDSMQVLNLLLGSNTIYGRSFTQPIINALKKFWFSNVPTLKHVVNSDATYVLWNHEP